MPLHHEQGHSSIINHRTPTISRNLTLCKIVCNTSLLRCLHPLDDAAQGDVAGSLTDFDAAYEADASLRPYLWQRGISAYYAEARASAMFTDLHLQALMSLCIS